jgi:hypothetical protein
MTNPLNTPDDYELFIYTLSERYPVVRRSTVRFVRRGATLARVVGDIYFDKEVRLVMRERIVYHRLPAIIDEYGYEVWQHQTKLYWYDSQPHPDDVTLQRTHPHHKHVPPDIKHHRIPAPGFSFTQPNLPVLIHEIETTILRISADETQT